MTRLILQAGACTLALAGVASADVIFTSFGEGDSYNTNAGYTIGTTDGSTDFDQGNAFTIVGGTYRLTSVEVAIGHLSGTNMLELTLHEDDGGEPGDVVELFEMFDFGPFGENNPALFRTALEAFGRTGARRYPAPGAARTGRMVVPPP